MWTTLLIVTVIFLVAIRIFLSVHNQIEIISAGLIATACVMIALGIAPLILKLALLATIFLVEGWLLHRQSVSES
jgi:sugar phosphate permease